MEQMKFKVQENPMPNKRQMVELHDHRKFRVNLDGNIIRTEKDNPVDVSPHEYGQIISLAEKQFEREQRLQDAKNAEEQSEIDDLYDENKVEEQFPVNPDDPNMPDYLESGENTH